MVNVPLKNNTYNMYFVLVTYVRPEKKSQKMKENLKRPF